MTAPVEETFERLLHLLADGEHHSGQELGEQLGISRTAVWKQLQKLEQLGVPFTSHRGRGYCIDGGLDLLDAEAIRGALGERARNALCDLTLLAETDSTNSYLLQGEGLPSGSVCLAERQRAGRGRRGRQWVSPFAQNIYLSLVWRFEGGAGVLEGLSLAVGVAIARALESLGFIGIALKWPNDLLYEGRKLAGILLEMSGDPAGECQVVVGVGVNVKMPAAVDIDQPWTDLATIAAACRQPLPARSALAAALLTELLPLLEDFGRTGFAAWRSAWLEKAAFINEEVELITASSRISGTLLGVDAAGALRLQVGDGEQVFHGGEVSLRSLA